MIPYLFPYEFKGGIGILGTQCAGKMFGLVPPVLDKFWGGKLGIGAVFRGVLLLGQICCRSS